MADIYTIMAQKRGYPCRSVYKLEQIDQQHRLCRPGLKVLDLGASPGSWLRYVSRRIGSRGAVLGLDVQPLDRTLSLEPNAGFLLQDVLIWDPPQRLRGRIDLVISDMAPRSSGIKTIDWASSLALNLSTLKVADLVLSPSGSVLLKTFRGDHFDQLRDAAQSAFDDVRFVKPKASRPQSAEIFLLARNKK